MSIEEIEAILVKTKAKQVVLFCHQNADPDAIGSVYAFSRLLKVIQPNLEIKATPAQGISKISREILKTIPLKTTISPRIEKADVIFLLDTNTLQQLGEWKQLLESATQPIVVIDHHAAHPETVALAQLAIIQEDATSTCEIIYEMFKQAKILPSKQVAQALLLGIAFDTKHFMIANSATFKMVAELVQLEVDVKAVLSLLASPMESSERISRLKAAKRLKLIKLGKWLIALSNVSSHQSSAARALLGLGTHVAVVCGKKDGEFRISIRSTEEFHMKTGIHLGRDIAQPLGKYIRGMGGGHSTSAGVNGKEKNFEKVYEKCNTLFQEKLKE